MALALHGVPTRLVLPVIVAPAYNYAVFYPNNLRPDLEAVDRQGLGYRPCGPTGGGGVPGASRAGGGVKYGYCTRFATLNGLGMKPEQHEEPTTFVIDTRFPWERGEVVDEDGPGELEAGEAG